MPMLIPVALGAFEAITAAAAVMGGAELTLALGLQIAGGAMAAFGALTGDKDLMALGAIAGIAGGVAGMAGAPATGSAADLARTQDAAYGAAGQASRVAEGEAAKAALTTETAAGGAANLAETSPGLLSQAMPPPEVNTAGSALAEDVSPLTQPGAAPAADVAPYSQAADSQAANLPQAPLNSAPTAPAAPGAEPPAQGVPYSQAKDSQAANVGGPQDWLRQLQNAGSGAVSWMKNNPELTKAGAGLVQGAMGAYSQEQLAQANMERAQKYQDWVRQRYSDSVRNLTIPGVKLNKNDNPGIIAGAKGP